jgi:hypothetical protein
MRQTVSHFEEIEQNSAELGSNFSYSAINTLLNR